MKKILIFSTAYWPLVGGAEVAVKEITDRLPDFQFDLITARMDIKLSKFERIGNVNVYRVGWGLGFLDKLKLPTLGWLKAKRLNKNKRYDLIWSIMASQASIAASFFKINQPRIKFLLTLQEGDDEEHLKRYVLGNDFLYELLIKPWHQLAFKKADFVTAISRALKERAIKNGVQVPIEIIPNAVDIKQFAQEFLEIELADLKQKIGKKPDEKYLITASRLVLKNAVDDVIRALIYLPDNIKFLILGAGPDLEKLKNLVKELKVEHRVIFLGQIGHDELPKYLRISDVFIRPSLSEGLGNAFLEAMAASLPVIATPVGGISDFLFDPQKNPDKPPTGLFCEVRNPTSIAAQVKLLFDDENLRNTIVINAKKMVTEKYDWDLIVNQMVGIFEKLDGE